MAHHPEQTLEFSVAGKLGGDTLIRMRCIGEIVKRQSISAQPQIPLLHGTVQQRFHTPQLGIGGLATDAVAQAHHLNAQHGVRHESADIRPQGEAVKVVHVVASIVPGNRLDTFAQHLFRDVLHAGKAVDDRILLTFHLLAEAGAQAAVAHQNGCGAVTHHLRQAGVQVYLQVEVCMNIQQAGHQPLAAAIDHAGRRGAG